ncbi:MAG: ELM1/GtrOC1 family putative glycosyltransferase [Candidatus Omnitrophota bacterium]|nr:ELM1/GtrOC1 family putative glycosyltransferase [Candidatus Omnitrophota bacterium]
MSKNSILDYLAYELARIAALVFLALPAEIYVWLGKIFGFFMFYIDAKHKNIAYRNIRFVFHEEKASCEIKRITKQAFENFGQNLFEILALKKVDKKYIEKYIRIEGRHFIDEALSHKKGLIFVTLHLGNWEISNAACGLFYQPYNVIVKEQKHGRLNSLLDSYRKSFGVNTVGVNSLKDIIRALENNEIVSIASDHGAGESDAFIEFFGRKALMPQGAVRLAAKFKASLIFAYIVRISGPHQKIVLEPFSSFVDTGDKEKDLEVNLREINKKFETYIRQYPEQYLWSYKRWKHSKERSVLILSDGKVGHLRQSQALAKIISGLGFNSGIKTIEIKFKSKISRFFLWIYFYIFGAEKSYSLMLKYIIDKDCCGQVERSFADIVISCGASGALINLIVSCQNKAKAIHILRPGLVSLNKFNLVVIPRHDHPPYGNNIAVTEGALNLIDETYLNNESEKLSSSSSLAGYALSKRSIGLLIGGDTKNFHLGKEAISKAIKEIKHACEKLGMDILATTSRRTPREVESLLKDGLKSDADCKLLVIANEKNIPEAVGAILGLSSVILVTPESISMVSEAANSGKYVVVFECGSIGARHRKFLDNLEAGGYIYVVRPEGLSDKIKELLDKKPAVKALKDRDIVADKLKKIV